MAEYKLLINGELVDGASGKKAEDINPATGEAFAEVPVTTTEDVERAVAAAREAFDDGRWSKLPHGTRAAMLEKLASTIEEHASELAELESQDAGKPIKLARDGDIPFSVVLSIATDSTCRAFSHSAMRINSEVVAPKLAISRPLPSRVGAHTQCCSLPRSIPATFRRMTGKPWSCLLLFEVSISFLLGIGSPF